MKDLGGVLDKGEVALVAMVDAAPLVTFEKSQARVLDLHSADTGLAEDDLNQAAPA